jgi:hypothetical protein
MNNIEIIKNYIIENNINEHILFDKTGHEIHIINDDDLLNVYEIDMSGNSQINKIPNFLNIFSNLKKINLSKCSIRKIEHLNKCINLEELFLRNNKITKIEGLDSCLKLKKLHLTDNPLKYSIYGLKRNSIKDIFKDIERWSIGNHIDLGQLNENYFEKINKIKKLSDKKLKVEIAKTKQLIKKNQINEQSIGTEISFF